MTKRHEPRETRRCVRNPAGLPCTSRSSPMSPPRNEARRSRVMRSTVRGGMFMVTCAENGRSSRLFLVQHHGQDETFFAAGKLYPERETDLSAYGQLRRLHL